MAIEFGSAQSAPLQDKSQRSLWSRMNSDIGFMSRGPGVNERMMFTERIELLLETGVSLPEALKVMRAQTEEQKLAIIIDSLIKTVDDGKSFSVALARHPEMFPQTYVTLVAAAEEGSFLPQVLQQLREMDERNAAMRSVIISALSYPAFLVLFSFSVVIFVLVVIFPKFTDLFKSIHDQLPITTIVLMYLSDVLRDHWLLVLVVSGGGLTGLVFWLRTPQGVQLLDQLKMRTPIIKDVFIQTYLIQTLSVLGMSLANGVPISIALTATQDIVRNSRFSRFLKEVLDNVEQGKGIALGFEQADFIPPMVRQMISTGEHTGNLAKVMKRVCDFYTRELHKRIATFAKAIEPVMLIVMGVVVGVIVSALILPIFKLSRVH